MTDYTILRVIDGGVGMICNEQLPKPHPNPLWGSRLVREAPDMVLRVHLEFLEAGADVIETNSYQLSVPKLVEECGLKPSEAADLITQSGRLAQDAVRQFEEKKKNEPRLHPLVAGSIGSYGAYLGDLSEYNGRYGDIVSVEELIDHHRPQLSALASNCDFFALETLPCLREAKALVQLMREFPNHRAWMCFTSLDGLTTCLEEPLEKAAEVAASAEGVFGLGINCSLPPRLVGPALKLMGPKKKDKILIAYPNQGERWCEKEKRFLSDPVTSIAQSVPEWVALGCRWIGGCCGARPVHTAEIAAAMQKERKKSAK